MSAEPLTVRLRFKGLKLWNGGEDFPYDVPVPRVPCIGEVMENIPDVTGWWMVADVAYDYSRGLHFPPIVRLLLRQR